MTYRERRLARADRLRGWADKRTTDAHAALTSDEHLRRDWAFITQPGRIPARERMNRRDDRAFRSLDKADGMRSRADEIARQADHAIYSDDEDATERLEGRIAELEAKRDARKAANAEYRKAHRAELAAMSPYERSQAVPWPSYSLSNLGGNIGRLRSRLAGLKARAAKVAAAVDAGGVTVKRAGEYAVVTFAEKPDVDVRTELKAAGYWFAGGSWNGRADALPARYEEES